MINKTKGISLIVLVITIIVMIIIAGAIILSLSNGNVIAKAKFAKESNDFAGIREMVEMENGNATFPDATFNMSNVSVPAAYTNDIQITTGGTNKATITIKYNANTKITDIPNAIDKLNAVYIPNGFTLSSIVSEQSKENGLVIIDNTGTGTNGNEYVWIPVEGTLSRTAFFSESLVTSGSTGFLEPITTAGAELDKYNAMKTSVEKYNGFYVSRYEAGYSSASLAPTVPTADGNTKPLSQKDKYVWNKVIWGSGTYPATDTTNGAAKVAKDAYSGNLAVTSGLLYGAQYDTMLNFIQSGGNNLVSTVAWGNHWNSTFTINSAGAKKSTDNGTNYSATSGTKPVNTSWLLTTGASEQNKAKNIYDVAGNVYEWTYEIYPAINNRVFRPGAYMYSSSSVTAAERSNSSPDTPYNHGGFRFALCIN